MMAFEPLEVRDSTSKLSEGLWKRAYESLEDRDKASLIKHGSQLSYQNSILINQTRLENEKRQWAVTLGNKSFKVRTIGLRLVGFIDASKEYIGSIARIEPHTAMVWLGISTLLPLVLQQKEQAEAMVFGLDRISYLLGLYRSWEGIYLEESNFEFLENVVRLYTAILAYQARMLDHLSQRTLVRAYRKMVSGAWAEALDKVNRHDRDCERFADIADVKKTRSSWERQYQQLSSQSETSQQVLKVLQDIRRDILNKALKDSQAEYTELIRSLSTDYKGQKNINLQRVDGTCEWFLGQEKFQQWRDGEESCLLHVHAGPGCGKSVLSRFLVDERRAALSYGTPILYFFFKDGQLGQTKCENALAAMLHQLYTSDTHGGTVVHGIPKYRAHGSKLATMFHDLWETLETTVDDPTTGEIICIFDALDECSKDDRLMLMNALTNYFSKSSDRHRGVLKVLITSRPYGDIDSGLLGLEGSPSFVSLDGSESSEAISKEIKLVIEHRVPKILKIDPKLQQLVITKLQEMDNKTYLWFHLALSNISDRIKGNQTTRKLENLINQLPPTVEKAYHDILQRSTDYHKASILLQLVLSAERPLSISELKVALELSLDEYDSYQDLWSETELDEDFTGSIRDLCGMMLQVYDHKVYLLHQTARTFLTTGDFKIERDAEILLGPMHLQHADLLMAHTCLRFLRLEEFQITYEWSFDISSLRLNDEGAEVKPEVHFANDHALFQYASQLWATHFRRADPILQQKDLEAATAVCSIESAGFANWHRLYLRSQGFRTIRGEKCEMVFPSMEGLQKLVLRYLEGYSDVELEQRLSCALPLAARYGHADLVRLLLDKGADVNYKGGKFCDLLSAAINSGRAADVPEVLRQGVDQDAPHEHGNALYWAAAEGREDIVKTLLERGADANWSCGEQGSALNIAISRDYKGVVKLLLGAGADFNAHGGWNGSALQRAAAGNGLDTDIAKMLLEAGADVNQECDGCCIIETAVAFGNKEVLRMLLSAGAEFDGSALLKAVMAGNPSRVQTLLEEGADINAQHEWYYSALHVAVSLHDEPMVQLLLDKGADTNACSEWVPSPLMLALTKGHEQVSKLLLDYRADLNHKQGHRCETVLHRAAMTPWVSFVELYLDYGADTNARDGQFRTPLHYAALSVDPDTVKLLVEAGTPIDAVDEEGKTALHHAVVKSYNDTQLNLEVAKLLLQAGAAVNIRDKFGQTALHSAAAKGGTLDIIRLLVDQGAELDLKDHSDDTALDRAYVSDRSGDTDLHRAHVFDRNAEEQAQIVEYLIAQQKQRGIPESGYGIDAMLA